MVGMRMELQNVINDELGGEVCVHSREWMVHWTID